MSPGKKDGSNHLFPSDDGDLSALIKKAEEPPAIRVAGMVEDSITDGPGLRFTLFTQGCPRHCPGCHNPQALPLQGGSDMLWQSLFFRIRKNPLYNGVTFSGGEPFLQASALLPLANAIRKSGYELAIYTGYLLDELLATADGDVRSLLLLTQVLVDGPFLLQERDLTLPFCGSKNQRILDVPKSLSLGIPTALSDSRWYRTA